MRETARKKVGWLGFAAGQAGMLGYWYWYYLGDFRTGVEVSKLSEFSTTIAYSEPSYTFAAGLLPALLLGLVGLLCLWKLRGHGEGERSLLAGGAALVALETLAVFACHGLRVISWLCPAVLGCWLAAAAAAYWGGCFGVLPRERV